MPSRLDEFMKESDQTRQQNEVEFINKYIQVSRVNTSQISDGISTFGELYEKIFSLQQRLDSIVIEYSPNVKFDPQKLLLR